MVREQFPGQKVASEFGQALKGFTQDPDQQLIDACVARGGKWDKKNRKCIEKVPEPPAPTIKDNQPNVPLTAPETFRDSKTRNLSGIDLPDGRTFLGLNPDDVNQIANKEAEKNMQPVGTQPVGTARNIAEQQARIQQLIQMAQQGILTPQELQAIQGANPDISQALGAGALGVIPGLAGGAATGLAAGLAGAAAGAGAGAAAGGFITPAALALGAVGAVSGFLISVRSNLKAQQAGEFSADQQALIKGERYLRSLITDTNQNPQNAAENIALFYQALNLIDAAHAKTWKDSQENLNRFLGNDGTPQLAKFETFNSTMRNYYLNQFEAALANPNPARILITAEDLGLEQ